MAVTSAGLCANNLHLAPNRYTNISSLDFYRLDALPDAQPTVSKHRRQKQCLIAHKPCVVILGWYVFSVQIGFTFLVLAYPGSPGKGPLNGCV